MLQERQDEELLVEVLPKKLKLAYDTGGSLLFVQHSRAVVAMMVDLTKRESMQWTLAVVLHTPDTLNSVNVDGVGDHFPLWPLTKSPESGGCIPASVGSAVGLADSIICTIDDPLSKVTGAEEGNDSSDSEGDVDVSDVHTAFLEQDSILLSEIERQIIKK